MIPVFLISIRSTISNGARDSGYFTFEYNRRGHQVYKVIKVDAATGSSNVIINEIITHLYRLQREKVQV